MTAQVFMGSFVGTGAAVNVEIGWIPRYVKCVNVTDGDTIHEWFVDDMADGTAIKTVLAVAAQASNGISAYQGVRGSNARGFTAGTDISEAGKTISYIAMRNPLT